MNLYLDYLAEIESRKTQGLAPKPIDDGGLTGEIIALIRDTGSEYRADALKFFIYNTLPGTTSAAGVKAAFLKQIILGETVVPEITPTFALELLSHMKGGPSIEALLDIALGDDAGLAQQAGEVLKTQVFLYDADMFRLRDAFKAGNTVAKGVLESYAKAEFFTKLPDVEDEIKVVTFIAAEGDISTDLLSPGNQAHSRSDRQLHGQCMITPEAQAEIVALQKQHPDKRVMMIAEKGTMGVGSSRMSGVNNVALWTGKQASPYVPFVNFAPIVAGTNGISPIFATTVDVTGGIGINLKNWVKKLGEDGKPILNNDGNPVLEQKYSVETGTVLKIDAKNYKLRDENGTELVDLSSSFTPQKMEFMKAGSSYAIVFGKKLQTFAAETLGVEATPVFAPNKEISIEGQGLTAVEKIFNRNAVGVTPGKVLHAGSDVRVKVNIVGSQDTTGLMTAQELEAMAATVISPLVDGAYQSGCHTASVWDKKAQANIPKLMSFMNNFGVITARDPKGVYHSMTDVIHKVLNDITVDDWAIIIGGDSHTRMSKGVAFGADSGTVALALATGEATMPIPQSVKVTFKGKMQPHMDFRDVVHATQAQMLKQHGDNVFQGRIIEVHIGTLLADQAFTFTDWTAEMKAKASICISEDETLIESLEIAKSRIQIMIDKGMDNAAQTLKGLIAKADQRIAEIRSGEKPALAPDDNAKYFAEVVVDLDVIDEPMIADPDVNNTDVSRRYTHDTIRPVSYYGGTKKVDLGFVGSCMVHKGDIKIVAQMLKNIEKAEGKVEFKAPLVVAAPTYNIIDELKAEGDWEILQKYSGFEFDDLKPKTANRTEYENILYLERPGCNLCMGNQEKAEKGDTVLATSTRLFQGRVVEDTAEKKGESLLASTPVVVLSAILGRTPSAEEYKAAVVGIDLTKFAPPKAAPIDSLSVQY
ncbi:MULTISPECIES: bifunctional aconitate hydratase 2/2-methylisocitrate dehydratase [Rhizobium/Agrobacterium group]|jgi:aconitate hydratase 2/2-methylisocitrate dehydratase|uniref:bifunctional aconitate hydratase 2/2-methylisocitrate dehydratase n=1 Tax=Rhizobium/Agrobacterium group TaxID=227290 RepID=UPI000361A0BD|nr:MULTISPECIES: bifunctional aconitate hydratase 2/2-methylisocitrate dehydratase [Rhizobium/Agrobacterium group]AHK04060.1 aconitate hydratase 2 [Agrobacterium tumefaciens LBA4213 (Ach5)]AKC09803.1 bifunctional aconitate hydratase 2/2-methylisocitrate dehydratase [Agrobacterium tumefaciens]AYM18947.1 bifunctional aconitate hydratase 2/2-methylisocitrate dehydratase [Agrobacterium tumefaciens]AYM70246.1 bifunctional aconitate hydratase 2/2-methylisocitrate dehydratase [Agrobacterium tumefacien